MLVKGNKIAKIAKFTPAPAVAKVIGAKGRVPKPWSDPMPNATKLFGFLFDPQGKMQ